MGGPHDSRQSSKAFWKLRNVQEFVFSFHVLGFVITADPVGKVKLLRRPGLSEPCKLPAVS